MNHCVYVHKTEDTSEVFYVGRAALSKGKHFSRAYSTKKRNKFWNAIVRKHGFSVSIASLHSTKQEADDEERRLIEYYGKRIDGGRLCNLADGGQGNFGAPRTDEWKKKISESHKGKKLSEEHKQKLRDAKRPRLSEEHKKKISTAAKRLVGFRLNDPEIRKLSQEARKKVKTKPRTPEHQEKINSALRGREVSFESRLKMSISAKNRQCHSKIK